MAERKKLALLVGHPEEPYQAEFIHGFTEHTKKDKFDVVIFSMFEKYQDSQTREKGASCIFDLINLEMFDAIVLLADTIQTPGVLNEIEERLHKEYQRPVLFVDKESKYFPSIKTDHYTATKQLIYHLIEEHGYKDIAYLTGKKYHPHSIERLQAYKDAMAEHGLPVPDNRVFYGDFWYSSGSSVGQELIRNAQSLPEAVACANDCMAIGLAGELEKNGIRVPEDVAVIGYDAVPVGKTSPKPVTSAPIPSYACGDYAVTCIEQMLAGEEIQPFSASVKLFIGRSCGCQYTPEMKPVKLRTTWETGSFVDDFESVGNHLSDDLLLQANLLGVVNTIFSFVHQIKPFHEFHLCLNVDWMEPSTHYPGFSSEMLHALQCSMKNRELDRVDISTRYNKKDLIPGLFGEEDRPHTYILSPLHFEDKCYGFAAVSYGDSFGTYTAWYRMWLGNVMRGLESFRRQYVYEQTNALLKAEQVRDSLTGFYNYDGLIENVSVMLSQFEGGKAFADIIAVDICGLTALNEHYGIQGGNQIIVDTAKMIEKAALDGICCGLGNGEFLVTRLSSSQSASSVEAFAKQLEEAISQYNGEMQMEEKLSIAVGSAYASVDSQEAIEKLVNVAVSNKNGNKVKIQRHSVSILTDEEKKEAAVVQDILDNNKLFYNFQPIVSASTGDIYAFEALMRADVQPFVSPLQILKYAEHFERLYDVEKATFFNVLNYIEDNQSVFEGKKVFINSIPGNRLQGEDAEIVTDKLKKSEGGVVVELTEQAELGDEELTQLKQDFMSMGIDIAVDDYGTGYSNVTNLLRYMPNVVKIDRMLLTGIQNSPQKQHFVREIVSFSHDNDILVLAEGVETSEELKTVIELGADLIQGYYTGKPSREVVDEIEESIKTEIVQYNQYASSGRKGKIHYAGQENKLSLVKVASAANTSIHCDPNQMNHRDIVISGVPGFESGMNLVIEDGYVGTIELQDSSFAGKKNQPAIQIGDNCEVTLVLNGDNTLEEGGIIVPESSKLRLIGKGNLYIERIPVDGCGIGHDKDHKHGDLLFEQYGAISVSGNVMQGVAIGSGLGGNITISLGAYHIKMSGQKGVGIGSLFADSKLVISKCSIDMNISVANNVGIGSMDGKADVAVSNASITGVFGGNESVAIGTLHGEDAQVHAKEVLFDFNMRCEYASGVGNLEKKADIFFKLATVSVVSRCKSAVALGSMSGKGSFTAQDVDLTTNVKSAMETDIGAEEIRLINGRCDFKVNGETIEREVVEIY